MVAWDRLALLLGIAILALSFGGCATGDQRIEGMPAEVLRHITGHDATTVSEDTTLYYGESPPSERLICHEGIHKRQAKLIGDTLAGISAIDDDKQSRTAAWWAVYGIVWSQYGRANRYELEAWAECGGGPQ